MGLGVLVDKDQSVKQAGGFIIQLMPFTPDEVVDRLEKKIQQIDSVTQMLDRGLTPEQILDEILGEFGLEITEKTERNHILLRRGGDAMRIIELGDDE